MPWPRSRWPTRGSSSCCGCAGSTADDDAGGAVADAARLCGLLGAYLILVSLVLLARLPLLDRVAGFARLTVWHRRAGTAGLLLVLAHAVLITVGYAAADGIAVLDELWRLISGYPGVITAIAGLVALVRRRRHLDRDRAAAAALRDVVLRPPVRVPRRRARLQPSARHRDRVRRPAARPHLLDGALRRHPRR